MKGMKNSSWYEGKGNFIMDERLNIEEIKKNTDYKEWFKKVKFNT